MGEKGPKGTASLPGQCHTAGELSVSCVTHHTCPQSRSRKLAFKEVGYLQSYSAMTMPGFKPSMAECLSPTAVGLSI